jgi:hypothetical protein
LGLSLTLPLLQVNTPPCATPFFEKKGDFEINAPKILEEFYLQFFLCVWMGKWLDYGEIFFVAICIISDLMAAILDFTFSLHF